MTKYIKNEIYPTGQNLYYKTWGSHQMTLFGVFVACVILLSAIYLYLAADMVMKAVDLASLQRQLGTVKQEYQELEKQYLVSISKFNLETAYVLGFIKAENSSVFLNRTSRLSQNY